MTPSTPNANSTPSTSYRTQWLGVAVYNPLLVLLALFCFPLDFIAEKQNSIIAHMAQQVGRLVYDWGDWVMLRR